MNTKSVPCLAVPTERLEAGGAIISRQRFFMIPALASGNSSIFARRTFDSTGCRKYAPQESAVKNGTFPLMTATAKLVRNYLEETNRQATPATPLLLNYRGRG